MTAAEWSNGVLVVGSIWVYVAMFPADAMRSGSMLLDAPVSRVFVLVAGACLVALSAVMRAA